MVRHQPQVADGDTVKRGDVLATTPGAGQRCGAAADPVDGEPVRRLIVGAGDFIASSSAAPWWWWINASSMATCWPRACRPLLRRVEAIGHDLIIRLSRPYMCRPSWGAARARQANWCSAVSGPAGVERMKTGATSVTVYLPQLRNCWRPRRRIPQCSAAGPAPWKSSSARRRLGET